MAKPTIVVDNTRTTMQNLIEDAKQASELARFALQLDDVESRRDAHIGYGRALLPLRAMHASDNGFNTILKENNLLVSDRIYRANCMWLAEFIAKSDGVAPPLHQCPYSSPQDIRQWYREKTNPLPKRTKDQSNIKGDFDSETKSEPEFTNTDDAKVAENVAAEIRKIENVSVETFRKELLSLFDALGNAAVSANRLQIMLNKNPTYYDHYKKDDITKIFNLWNRLVKQMERIKR